MSGNPRYNGKETFEEWQKQWQLEDRYNFRTIESKWQKIWEDEKIYHVDIDKTKQKFYALVEFPYPSGADSMSDTRVHTRLLMLSPVKSAWKAITFYIRWALTHSVCRQKTMPLKPVFIRLFQLPPTSKTLPTN